MYFFLCCARLLARSGRVACNLDDPRPDVVPPRRGDVIEDLLARNQRVVPSDRKAELSGAAQKLVPPAELGQEITHDDITVSQKLQVPVVRPSNRLQVNEHLRHRARKLPQNPANWLHAERGSYCNKHICYRTIVVDELLQI
eukprot:XP_001707720.1 Hypothetical protein GL50803_20689 [Giardia lamblia ATCC 50803]